MSTNPLPRLHQHQTDRFSHSDVVPDSEKSTTQSMQDKASRTKDNNTDKSLLDKAKDATGLGK